ncbi:MULTISPECIES: hypothetical protein [unclassified Blastococcus]
MLLAVLTAGCTTTIAGTAAPAGSVPATPGPLTTVTGAVGLAVEDGHVAYAIAAHPDGHHVAVLGPGTGYNTGSDQTYLGAIVPGDDGAPALADLRPFPAIGERGQLAVAPDGTIVAGTTRWDGETSRLALYVLRPGADEPELLDFTGAGDAEFRDLTVSPDGDTLYVGYRFWFADTRSGGSTVAAVDLPTGEFRDQVTASADVPGRSDVLALAPRPDGGVTALMEVGPDRDDIRSGVRLIEYDADLDRRGPSIDLGGGAENAYAFDLTVTADGTTVVPVATESPTDRATSLVVVRDRAVDETLPLPAESLPTTVVGDPSGRYVYLPLQHPDLQTTLATVDLRTGRTVAEAPLCAAQSSYGDLVAAADGRSVAITRVCEEGAFAFVVGASEG